MIYTFEEIVAPALASGALELVLTNWLPYFTGPFLYAGRRHLAAPLRAFVDFVRNQGRFA